MKKIIIAFSLSIIGFNLNNPVLAYGNDLSVEHKHNNEIQIAQDKIPNESLNVDYTSKSFYEDINFLASDKLEGRRAGTKSADIASEYIANKFKSIGLKPAGNNNSYFQSFNITVGINPGKNNVFQADNINAEYKKDFIPLSFSESLTVEGDLVFAGYGITAPEYKYDDYKNLNVKDKIVIVLRHEPQEKNEKSQFNGNKPTQYSELRYKVFTAKNLGAKAVILINGKVNYDNKEDDLINLNSFGGTANLGIPVIQVKNSFIEKLLDKKDLKRIQENIDNNFKTNSFSLNKKARISVDLNKEYKPTNNVIGLIEGSDKNLKDEVIVIGAHYDHLGMGGDESLSKSKLPMIHNGADDNASGVAGILELARQIKSIKPKRTIAFISFSGEELGLLGSSYFTSFPTFKNIVSMINMDMIGRLNKEKLYVGGIKTATSFENIVKDTNSNYKFDLSYFKDGYGPSDHMSFYLKDIPVLFFFTGVHDDYHRPTDDIGKINFKGLDKIISYVKDITIKLDNQKEKPQLVKIAPDPNMSSVSTGKGNGAYLGTIPDYSSMDSDKGVKISGVTEGSPAAKGGMKRDDIIIKFDNLKINTIYDYTYALKSKKPGDKIIITVMRNNKKLKLNIITGKK